MDQLASITYDNGATRVGEVTYTYDAAGRRVGQGGSLVKMNMPETVDVAVYNAANRPTIWGASSLSYDNNGNLTSLGEASFGWNPRDELISASSGMSSFAYDVLGRRTSRTVAGSITTYLYDDLNPTTVNSDFMLDGLGIDEVNARVSPTGTTSYVKDALGTIRLLTDVHGNSTAGFAYAPYGQSTKVGSDDTSFQFTGRENDGSSSLYYYRARYYSPILGRFLSEDPIGLAGGINVYAYALGDPLSNHDPYGLYSVNEFVGDAANFSAGWGDTLSFGITAQIRNGFDIGAVDKCSGAYTGGEIAGFANGVGIGWAQGLKATAKAASQHNWANFSHSLFPHSFLKRYSKNPLAKWMNRRGNRLNGDFVSPELHTRMDVRAQFGLGPEHLAANPLFGPLRQMINRVPYIPGSIAYGAGSAAMNSCGCN